MTDPRKTHALMSLTTYVDGQQVENTWCGEEVSADVPLATGGVEPTCAKCARYLDQCMATSGGA